MSKIYFIITVLTFAAITLFAFQNGESISVSFLTRSAQIPKFAVIAGSYLLGMVTGWGLIGFIKHAIKRSNLRSTKVSVKRESWIQYWSVFQVHGSSIISRVALHDQIIYHHCDGEIVWLHTIIVNHHHNWIRKVTNGWARQLGQLTPGRWMTSICMDPRWQFAIAR